MFKRNIFNDNLPESENYFGDRKLISEVHNSLQIIRTLLQNDKNLCNMIDENYEEMLLSDLRTVPEQYDHIILEALDIIKIFINNINFIKISEELAKYSRNNMKIELDTFHIFETCINKLEINKKDKARIMNIITKFKPLFTCIDALLYKPIKLIKKIGTMKNNILGDLF